MPVKFFNQKGFTLPEVLIGAALLGGVALITAKLMGDQAAQQAYIVAQSEVSKTVSEIESYLNNPATCGQLLRLKAVGTDVGPFTIMTPGGPKIVLQPGTYNQYSIMPGAGQITLQPSTVGRSVAEVVIVFRLNNKSIKQRRDPDGYVRITKRIPVVVQLSGAGAGTVDDCGPVLDENVDDLAKQKMCDSIKGSDSTIATWNTTTKTCDLKSVKCPFGQTATKVTSLGGIICTKIEDQYNPSDYFELGTVCPGPITSTTQIGLVRDPGSKKLKIQCIP